MRATTATAGTEGRLDYAAIGISVLCVLHCTALPVLAVALPWIAAVGLAEAWFHQAMLLVVVPVSALALGWSWQRLKRNLPPVLGALGLAVMVFAAFEMHPIVSGTVERDLTLFGAGLLTLAHGINLRNLFRCSRISSPEALISSEPMSSSEPGSSAGSQ